MCYKNEYQKRAHGEVEQIFRELLPEAGLHVREEQIRLCHEMLDALMKMRSRSVMQESASERPMPI